jgi:hypothetical protein
MSSPRPEPETPVPVPARLYPIVEESPYSPKSKTTANTSHCVNSFNNVSGKTTTYLGHYFHTSSLDTTCCFFKRHVATRVTNLALVFLSLIPATIDTLTGAIAGIEVFLSLGRERTVVNFAAREFHATNDFLSRQYEFLLRVLNPKAHFASRQQYACIKDNPAVKDSDIAIAISDIPAVGGLMGRIAIKAAHNNNVFVKHVVSRLAFATTAVAAVISRAAYAVLAVPAIPLSILTGGYFQKLNAFVSRGLSVAGVVNDIFMCAVKVMNPWAGNEDPEVVRLKYCAADNVPDGDGKPS